MKAKYLIISLLIFFAMITSIKGQDSWLVNPNKIDSLHTLIDQSKDDKEKVRLLNEYARLNFYNQEYKIGLIAAVDARELATEIEYSGGEVMFHLTIAAFLGNGELMDYHLRQARVLTGHNNEVDLYIVPTYPNEYPPATDNVIEKLNTVLLYFEKTGNKEIQAIIISRLGYVNFTKNNYKNLQVLLNKGIQLYKDLDQLYPLFLYHNYRMNMVNQGIVEGDKEQLENELKELLTRKTNKNQLLPFYHQLASFYNQLGQSGIAIDYFLKSVAFFKSTNNLLMLNEVYNEMSKMYESLEMFEKQAEIVEKRIAVIEQLDLSEDYIGVYRYAVWTMLATKKYDKAREYMEFTIQTIGNNQWGNFLTGQKNSLEGQILMDQNRYDEALPFLKKSYKNFSKRGDHAGRSSTPWEAMHLANCYYKIGDLDAALRLGLIALDQQVLTGEGALRLDRKTNKVLYEIYDALGKESKAFKHLKYYHELIEKTKIKDNANLLMEAEVRAVLEKSQIEITRLEQERVLKEQQNKTQRLWIFSIAGALLSVLLVAFILYRNNKIKQKANARLKKQKEEIQTTLEQLEATQKQLIQSEKMASLGELTAGIAHEIQNPLNFVTNFSEVSQELIIELKEEIENNSKKDIEEILENINQNLGKINHHGKRASSIVKGMLDHSRTSKGVKILTDINLLADEYLRLSYHGLRAKDKSFNADFTTEFDSSIPKISIVPQDFGRVILNLINNAFYSINKKSKEVKGGYRPMVTIGTKKVEGAIKISIKDNGEGIPREIIDKIFQPFFTTKPTGEGTGLGLSLAYDIVSKGYGGKLIADSKKGSYTEFSILLPIKNKE